MADREPAPDEQLVAPGRALGVFGESTQDLIQQMAKTFSILTDTLREVWEDIREALGLFQGVKTPDNPQKGWEIPRKATKTHQVLDRRPRVALARRYC